MVRRGAVKRGPPNESGMLRTAERVGENNHSEYLPVSGVILEKVMLKSLLLTFALAGTAHAAPHYEEFIIRDGATTRFAWVITDPYGTRTVYYARPFDTFPGRTVRPRNYPAQLPPVPEVRDRYKSSRSSKRSPGKSPGLYWPEGPQMIENPYYKAKQ